MPYTIRWYIPDEVVYVHYSGVVSVDELRNSLQEMYQYTDSSPRHLIHTISDAGDVITPTTIKDSIKIVREVGNHPRQGWTMSIREKSPLIKMVSAMGSSVFRLRYRSFDTLDQALAHLKEFDAHLSWNKAESPKVES